jgi:acetyl esterase/lipase
MNRIRNRLVREVFRPAMRLFRDTLLADPNVPALRRWVARMESALAHDEPGATTRRVGLAQCEATWFEVAGAQPGQVILYLHGGAFVFETPRLHGAFLTRLARDCGMCALMPHYRLAPEHPFPAAADDALASYRWLLAQGIEASRIVVAGDSAGGNLCLGLLQRLRHDRLPMPACALAMSPLTDATFGGDSVRRNDGLDPMFTASGFHKLAPLYLRDASQRAWPLASPLLGDLDGMPPTLLTVGSSELLLDDSVRYALRCRGAELQVWHDMPHVFPLFEFLPQAAEARKGMRRFIGDALAAQPPRPALPDRAANPDGVIGAPPLHTQPQQGDIDGTRVQRAD